MTKAPLLDIRDLSIAFRHGAGESLVVDRGSFSLEAGRTLALVGESGSRKEIPALSVVRLLASSARYPSGEILFNGEDLLRAPEHRLRDIRGAEISMVFQEPMTSLNPLHAI